MGSDWMEVSVEDIKAPLPNALATGPFGSSISSRFFQDDGVPVIRGSNLSEDIGKRLISEDIVFVSNEKAQEFSRSIARRGDLVFTCWGTIGQVGLIDERSKYSEYVISNKQMKLTPDPERVDSLFLYYLFSGPEMSSRIKNQAIGSSVPGFNLGQLKTLKLLLPPLDEQKAIAHILGTLDDKIELNQQMNHTLESIARTLFKSWFIDFDPVRAKMDGRQPAGMDAETAALFPDEFEDSSLGKIPKGWEVKTLGDFIDIKHGYAFKGEFFRDQPPGDILLTPGNFAMGGGFKNDKFKYYVGEVPEEFVLMKGDFLVTMTDLSKLGDTLGYPAILPTEREGRYLHNQRLGKVLIKSENTISKLYLYYLLRTNEYRQEILAGATGTTVKHTSPGRIQAFKLFAPPAKLSLKFDAMVDLLFEKMSLNNDENQSLTVARDVLLPKLLSGEIRVKNAEKVLEEVA